LSEEIIYLVGDDEYSVLADDYFKKKLQKTNIGGECNHTFDLHEK
jgi:hypothetical protein